MVTLDVGKVVIAKDADHPTRPDLEVAADLHGPEPAPSTVSDIVRGEGDTTWIKDRVRIVVEHPIAAAGADIATRPVRGSDSRRRHHWRFGRQVSSNRAPRGDRHQREGRKENFFHVSHLYVVSCGS